MERNKKYNPEDYDLIILNISREEIEGFDHIGALSFLHRMKTKARKYEGKLNILVDGYENDIREIHEIDEIRVYFDFLDRCFPYWFYFITTKLPPLHSPLAMLISLLLPSETISKNDQRQSISVDMPQLKEFMDIHFHFLNEISDEIKINEAKNIYISKQIIENISKLFNGDSAVYNDNLSQPPKD